MKAFIAALAGLVLLSTPLAASARGGSHGGGGGGGGGGLHGAGGFHGGGFRDGGFRGGGRFGDHGFERHGFRGRGFGGFDDGFFFGADLGLGLGFYDPWFYGDYGYPDYGDYGFPAYTQYVPAPADRYYRGPLPTGDGPSNGDASAVRPDGPTAKLCGSWKWDASGQAYDWVTGGC